MASAATKIMEKTARWVAKQAQKRAPVGGDNRFLEGAYAPVASETTSTKLKVTGTIPKELDGILARIGPNPIHAPNPATYHWFVGDGMVHGLRLLNGEALWYRNRWVGTDKANRELQRPLVPGKRHGIVETVNTNIIGHNGSLWALVEAGALPVEMDTNLDTVQHGLFRSDAVGAFSAHPHFDPLTGELHAICYNATQPNRIHYHVIDKHGQLARRVPIPVKHGPMIHDCNITRSKAIILDLPVTFSFASVLKGATFPYKWNKRHAARVGLLPRTGHAEDIRWYKLEPCYVFHTCNAFDTEDGSVIMDVVVHARMFDQSIQGPEAQKITLERWTLSPNSDQVKREVISDRAQEFPRFDERLTTKDYRYAYTVGADLNQPDSPQPLLRHDIKTGQCTEHFYGPTKVSGEVVFVPRSEHSAENDGWLLSYVYDLENDTSEVVILNADDLDGEPQAVIEIPVRVPMGFHGNWIAS
ncbi:MAG: carotenoid oxygenase family protein [Alcanivoracaceae bacterium]|nr:carotenoid oxygenase family protein [Alcanivoracaceae bacterium]